MNKKVFRIFASACLMESRDRLRFFTLTVKEDNLPLREVANRWRVFANTRWWRRFTRRGDYILVYEPHPSGHGWHIHCITNFFLPWQELQLMARVAHFGHTDIMAVDSNCALYVAKYVSKSEVYRSLAGCRNVRIVNVSRGLLPLVDIQVDSPSIRFCRANWDHPLLRRTLPFQRFPLLYSAWIASFCGVCLTPFSAAWLDANHSLL